MLQVNIHWLVREGHHGLDLNFELKKEKSLFVPQNCSRKGNGNQFLKMCGVLSNMSIINAKTCHFYTSYDIKDNW